MIGLTAAAAAYQEGGEWLEQLLVYLQNNRDFLYQYVSQEMPGIKMSLPEGTFLAWLDCRDVIQGNPQEFFLQQARVALNDGATFGEGGEGFVRINFGCTKNTLRTALRRMRDALGFHTSGH
jgi:cystathionine beta-lyase